MAARGARAARRAHAAHWRACGDTDDPRSQPNITAFVQTLQQLGWTDGRNVKIDYRWPAGDADKARKYAAELVALAPDIILAIGTPSLASLLQATRTVPIVFVAVSDPVGAGYVDSLSRPGGNATGFILFDYSEHEMAGAAQADRAGRNAGCHPSGSRNNLRDRPVGRDQFRGAVARRGGEPGQRAGRA